MRSEFLWEQIGDLDLLIPTDVSWAASRVSCDQDIAGDGFFSVQFHPEASPGPLDALPFFDDLAAACLKRHHFATKP